MEKTRIEALRETLLANPDAAFVRYALAMELSNAGHSDEAWPHFENKKFEASFNADGLSVLRHNTKNWDVMHTAPFST